MTRRMGPAEHMEVAERMGELLEAEGLQLVFVGSTAVVGLGLFERTSKDADALVSPETTIDEVRAIATRIAEAKGLVVKEKGWGTVALVHHDAEGLMDWQIDLIVPGEGMIPPGAARRIHERATTTRIGPTAIPEHIVAMKAIACGDCMGKGQVGSARRYESDLRELRSVASADFAWDETRRVLAAFHQARSMAAGERIKQIFGVDLGFDDEPDPAVG